jgi:signal transduction histidine kinase
MTDRLPLRLRVALVFACTTAVALTALGVFIYLRVQDTLREQTEQALATETEALRSLPAAQRLRAVSELSGVTFAQVLSRSGRVVATSPQLVSAVTLPTDRRSEEAVEQDLRMRDDDEAEPALLRTEVSGAQILVVGRSMEPEEEALDGVRTQFLLGVPIVLLVASLVGYGVAGVALRPVERMRRRAASITALDPRSRLPLPAAQDEIRRLGSTLNAMLDRLEAAADRERDFVAEAGHELRTPLALLRMELDLALSSPRTQEELLTALGSASEEVERLTALAEDLLLRADHEEKAGPDTAGEVSFEALAEHEARRFAPLAERAGRRIRITADHPGPILGDPVRLGRALGNLVHNALVHGVGEVTVRARREDGSVVVLVQDEGPARPAPLDSARLRAAPEARTAGAHGRGLGIVRLIVEEYGGSLEVGDFEDGSPSTVTLRLPGAPHG